MGKYWIVVGVVLAAGAAMPAHADIIDSFEFDACTPNQPGGLCGPITHIYTWEAPASPTPTSFCSPRCFSFSIIADVFVDRADFGSTTIWFGNDDEITYGGGFRIPALNVFGDGPKLWTGVDSAPTFSLGTFVLRASDLPSPEVGTFTSSTPEPSSLSLLGMGFLGLIGFRFKSRIRLS